nr:MAG TPA: hypothetical protein [Bacteriophage sp.]
MGILSCLQACLPFSVGGFTRTTPLPTTITICLLYR